MGLFGKRDPEVVLDLRDEVVATVKTPPPTSPSFEFGFPTRCPSCAGRGYLDHIDPFKRIQFEHCPSCFTKWERSEEDILALDA